MGPKKMNDSTDTLIQVALNGPDLFDTDPGSDRSVERGSSEIAQGQIQALLSSLTPELRDAISSSFGLEDGVAIDDHKELIDRALSQLRLAPAATQVVETVEQRQVQAA